MQRCYTEVSHRYKDVIVLTLTISGRYRDVILIVSGRYRLSVVQWIGHL